MIDQRLAERHALAGVTRRDVVRAPGRSGPSHAMGEPRGREPDLRVAPPLADLAENIAVGHMAVVEADHGLAAGKRAVERVEGAFDSAFGPVNHGETQTPPSLGLRPDAS